MAPPKVHDPASVDFLSLESTPEEILTVNEVFERIRQASIRHHERQLWKMRMKDALLLALMTMVITWPLATLLFAGVR